MNMTSSTPRLSYVVAADRFETIRSVAEHLDRQSVASEVELVVATPSSWGFGLPERGSDVIDIRLVEVPLLPVGRSRAAAVRESRGKVVVLGETHTFPSPGWAERLLRAHEGPWAAVAPGFENANPNGARSWASFLMDYGNWLAGVPVGETTVIPDYNAAWKIEVLLALSDLEELLEPGGGLPTAAVAGGCRFYQEPAARVEHLNLTRPGAWIYERFLGGRLVAAGRSRRWPLARRIVYFLGSPLIPVIRLLRTRPAIRLASGSQRLPGKTSAVVALAGVFWATGEAVGYVAGAGSASKRMLEYEMHKRRYARAP